MTLQSGDPLILDEENDLLKVLPKVKFLKGFIEDNFEDGKLFKSDSDRMIALYGGWGTGKSSVMKTLCMHTIDGEELKTDNSNKNNECLNESIETIFFEAWKYEKDHNLVLSLFHYLGDYLYDDNRKTESNKYARILLGLAKGFSLNLGVVQLIGKDLVEGVIDADTQNLTDNRVSEYITVKKIEKGIYNLFNNSDKVKGKDIVVFIDDLDRCESENVINLLSAIKLFFTYMPDTVFVVGVDKKAVTLSLKNKYNNDENKAEEYLEKIFTMSFNMPKVVTMEKLVYQYFNNHITLDPPDDINRLKLTTSNVSSLLMKIGFNNPRHLNKVFNKFKVILPTLDHSLDLVYGKDKKRGSKTISVLISLGVRFEDIHDEYENHNLHKNNLEKKKNIKKYIYSTDGIFIFLYLGVVLEFYSDRYHEFGDITRKEGLRNSNITFMNRDKMDGSNKEEGNNWDYSKKMLYYRYFFPLLKYPQKILYPEQSTYTGTDPEKVSEYEMKDLVKNTRALIQGYGSEEPIFKDFILTMLEYNKKQAKTIMDLKKEEEYIIELMDLLELIW